jgi:hypothetical protein
VYSIGPDNELIPLAETPYERELDLQEALADHPELLVGEQMNPVSPRRFVLVTNSESGRVNFFRYGMPVADGEKRTFIGLLPAENGARVSACPPFSPASEAGLQGDIVSTINGTSLAGMSLDQIRATARGAATGQREEFEVVGADGKKEKIVFEARDLRWFVERRSSSRQ